MKANSKKIPKIKIKEKLKLMNKKIAYGNDTDDELNQSWDFTPFPKLYFPSEKKNAIKVINRLNFENNVNQNTPINTIRLSNINKLQARTPHIFKSNSASNIFQEIKGDITKCRPPAYSFGTSREECKIPFLDFREKISPSPGSYNLRPLIGLGGSSLKYSINKKPFVRYINLIKSPGPGQYNIDKTDSKYNGNIILSNYPNSPICHFSKYREKRDNNYFEHSEWNIKPAPSKYNINDTLSMFNGTGKYPISTFKNNLSKSINRSNSLSRIGMTFVSPGPGHYNHYSMFGGHKY